MQTISVINYKGGVGKTTLVANIAAELGWRGNKVLLIDLDPQASLTFSFLNVDDWMRDYASNKTIRSWYEAYLEHDQNLELASLIVTPSKINSIVSSSDDVGGVDIICSHLSLINIDLELATRLGGATFHQNRINYLRLHSRLLNGLESIRRLYDYTIIDCPPNFNIVTKTAIVASNHILVPAIQDYLSTMGIEELQRHIDELVDDYNRFVKEQREAVFKRIAPSIMGVVPTMIQMYDGKPINAQATFIDVLRKSGIPVFDTFVRRNNTIYGDAPQYGVPVVLQSVEGEHTSELHDVLISELEELTTELINRL